MAGGASGAAVGGEALVVEQGLAERALRLGVRIRRRERNRGGPAEFVLQRPEIVAALRQRRDGADERAADKRRNGMPLRGAKPAHISLPTESSMRDTSLKTAA
ncbi:MAG: hypothetical protein QOH67_923 [Hyphomicrobiales bacterium]|jgi:hypothetical protein|nr:hypothetical protein [Hyphomicrobiales bacterium]